MLRKCSISVILIVACVSLTRSQQPREVRIDFCGEQIVFNAAAAQSAAVSLPLTKHNLNDYYAKVLDGRYTDVLEALHTYKKQYAPDDWLFYQLIRRTAEHITPKKSNYFHYTLHKWYLLTRSGYDAILTTSHKKMLFYVRCDENIYNIPTRIINGKQYVCLNYHDYGSVDFNTEQFDQSALPAPGGISTFTYRVTRVPDIRATAYLEKQLHFSYYENDYHFKVKLSPQVQQLFNNYPVVDYDAYLNIPLSPATYNSLMPQLKRNVKGMNVRRGVDYLMRFTRYAFLFEPDSKLHGGEKRLSAEQTLLYDGSDCEDRVALFFCLVKEIYDLPMIVLSYPSHVTVAVQFDEPVGNTIVHEGRKYTVCEPTPQKKDLAIGELLPELQKIPYSIAYVYDPAR